MIRSALFNIAFWAWIAILGLAGLPFTLLYRPFAHVVARMWARGTLWLLRVLYLLSLCLLPLCLLPVCLPLCLVLVCLPYYVPPLCMCGACLRVCWSRCFCVSLSLARC